NSCRGGQCAAGRIQSIATSSGIVQNKNHALSGGGQTAAD
ncbi:MAG: hypothetical protein G01um101413_508, partial [Parcubacteria group bacterium Gr01-1014_13]